MGGEWPTSWKRAKLGEIADVNWGDTNVTKKSYVTSGYIAFSATGPDGFLPYYDYDRVGVVLSAIGAQCGRTWLAKGKWSCIKNTIRFWSTSPDVDTEFLYWATRNPSIWPKRGSAQSFIAQEDARSVEIAYPPLSEQRAIAHILGTLDDKIELNRRMSETLEQMARAIFKAWFVDFEPVRAKMEGRWRRGESLPGLPAHLYDLFPDRLVDSELGEIPEGWEVGTLSHLAEVTSGKRPSKVLAKPEPKALVPVWGGSGPMGYVTESLYSETILLTGRVGTLGSVFRVQGPSWPSDNTLVILPHSKAALEYLYFSIKQFDFDAMNRGSTQPLLAQSDLAAQDMLIPADRVLTEFHRHASTYFMRIDQITNESRTLAALRDALLPKLISGELRVKDAERFLKERGL